MQTGDLSARLIKHVDILGLELDEKDRELHGLIRELHGAQRAKDVHASNEGCSC